MEGEATVTLGGKTSQLNLPQEKVYGKRLFHQVMPLLSSFFFFEKIALKIVANHFSNHLQLVDLAEGVTDEVQPGSQT